MKRRQTELDTCSGAPVADRQLLDRAVETVTWVNHDHSN